MTDHREQPDLDARWAGLARYLAGESTPEEERLIRQELERDPERAALVSALDAALATPDRTPLSPTEVEDALASVMGRRDRPAAHADAEPGVVPLRTSASIESVLAGPRTTVEPSASASVSISPAAVR